MPRFWYTAGDGQQQLIEADNLCEALLSLRERGVAVTSAGAVEPPAPRPMRQVSQRLLISMYDQLGAMVADGIGLPAALRGLAAEARSRALRRSLETLASRVEDGRQLSEAMAEQPRVYSEVAVSMIAAAEEAGSLPEGLRALTEHHREMGKLAAQAAFPLVYPLIVVTVVFSLVTFMVTFIVPKFVKLFTDLGVKEFPWPTALLMSFVRIFPSLIVAVGIPTGLLVLFYGWYRRTSRGQFDIQLLQLHLPLFGRLALYTATARMADTLSLLLRGGVPTGRALRLAGQASGNSVVGLALRRAEATVRQGGRLADGLRETDVLPETFTFGLGVAEASGSLVGALDHLSEEYMQRAIGLGRFWATASGPIIVLILGMMVGGIALSMFMPLLSVISSLSQ